MKVLVLKEGVKRKGSKKQYPVGRVFACTKEFAQPFINNKSLREVSEKELTDSEKEFFKQEDNEGKSK